MNDQDSGDVRPDTGDMVHVTSDAVLHSPARVRDAEARIARLSPCILAPIDLREATRVTLTFYPLALKIPGLGTANTMDVPDDGWQGWQWSTNEFLLLHVDANPEFAMITHPGPQACRLDIVGRPMWVRRVAPGDPGWAANAYAAEVLGYLDDATLLWGQAVAATESRREALLAGLATLERDPDRSQFEPPSRGG